MTERNRQWLRVDALRTLNERGSLIYAIRTRDDLIKIGISDNVAQRRRFLGDEILALKFGDQAEEQRIHRTLAPHRARGREYYHPVAEVLDVVEEIKAAFSLEPAG